MAGGYVNGLYIADPPAEMLALAEGQYYALDRADLLARKLSEMADALQLAVDSSPFGGQTKQTMDAKLTSSRDQLKDLSAKIAELNVPVEKINAVRARMVSEYCDLPSPKGEVTQSLFDRLVDIVDIRDRRAAAQALVDAEAAERRDAEALARLRQAATEINDHTETLRLKTEALPHLKGPWDPDPGPGRPDPIRPDPVRPSPQLPSPGYPGVPDGGVLPGPGSPDGPGVGVLPGGPGTGLPGGPGYGSPGAPGVLPGSGYDAAGRGLAGGAMGAAGLAGSRLLTGGSLPGASGGALGVPSSTGAPGAAGSAGTAGRGGALGMMPHAGTGASGGSGQGQARGGRGIPAAGAEAARGTPRSKPPAGGRVYQLPSERLGGGRQPIAPGSDLDKALRQGRTGPGQPGMIGTSGQPGRANNRSQTQNPQGTYVPRLEDDDPDEWTGRPWGYQGGSR